MKGEEIMDRYEMNVALNGQHWARVNFGHVNRAEAIRRALMLSQAIKASDAFYLGHDLSFDLTVRREAYETVKIADEERGI